MVTVEGFTKRHGDEKEQHYKPQWHLRRVEEEGTDARAYQDNFITVTPLRFDWTDSKTLQELQQWDLSPD